MCNLDVLNWKADPPVVLCWLLRFVGRLDANAIEKVGFGLSASVSRSVWSVSVLVFLAGANKPVPLQWRIVLRSVFAHLLRR